MSGFDYVTKYTISEDIEIALQCNKIYMVTDDFHNFNQLVGCRIFQKL